VTSWQELRDEAASCTRCDLFQRATQTVSRDRAYAGLVADLAVAGEACGVLALARRRAGAEVIGSGGRSHAA